MRTRRILGVFGQIVLFLIFALIFSFFGFLFVSSRQALFGLILGLFVSLVLCGLAETLISWFLGASSQGVSLSLVRDLNTWSQAPMSKVKRPRVLIYPSPFPQVWLVRGLFGRSGTLFLSQGLVSSIKGPEFHMLFSQAIKKLPQVQTCLLSYNAVLLALAVRVMPAGWLALMSSRKRMTESEQKDFSLSSLIALGIAFPLLNLLVRLVIELNSQLLLSKADVELRHLIQSLESALGPWETSLGLSARLGGLPPSR